MTQSARILFIEDDASGRELGVFNLTRAGYETAAAASGLEGLRLFEDAPFDLVITDVKMPDISGLEVLAEIRKRSSVPVLVITAFADVETAVNAMKAGADDFIGKPFNRDFLLMTVEKALRNRALSKEVRRLRARQSVERPILYRSRAMQQTLAVADRVAGTDATVLITGESGTGKELAARRIHVQSDRAENPFVAVNAAAVPAELLESELFGHVKGAFTGASTNRPGRFRQAENGTLFLDEIGELPLALQTKLLRALQERVVDVVGSDNPVPVNARVIAATNKDLLEAVRRNQFREDLYYRLNALEVRMPALRERPEDIPLLAEHFLAAFSDGRELALPDAVVSRLTAHSWPGNVRELENVCLRLAVLTPGREVRESDLPDTFRSGASPPDDDDTFSTWPPLPPDGLSLVDLERRVIERALRLKDGNVSQTAAYLQIPRHVLAYRMQKYGLAK